MAEGLTCTSDPRNGFSVPASSDGSLFQRRIEFHPGLKAFTGFSNGSGDFFLEALNPSLGSQNPASNVGTSSSTGKKSEDGDVFEHGLDPELSFGITFRRIGAGLENLGNTCFLNSVLQCLTYTEPFAAYLQSGKHQSSCHIAGFCAMCAIQNHVRRALQSTGRILAPKDLVMNLRCISRNFRNARQEDAHEYMVNLLESMHKCCLPSGVPSESPSAYEKSLVHKIFGGRLRSQVKCMQCSYCSNTFDPFLDLSLEIDKADSLHKALRHFTAIEQLDGGERHFQCQRCKQKVIALKQLTVHRAPYVLTIHLKRFGSYVPGEKIDKKVEFGPTLDFKPFVSGSYEGNLKYTLYGVLVHAGWSTHSGHYYCYVRTSSGMWYSLDDNQVVQVSERTVLEQKAYMLFYVRDRRSLMPKKSVDVFNKENIVTNIIENNKCSSSSLGLKGTVQNVLIERRLCTSECSVTSAQRDALGGGSAKHPSLKEPSVKSNGLVMAEGSVVLEDLLLEPSLKEPLLKDPVKGSPVLHYTNGKFESNGATVAPGGVKTDPGNKHDESKKDLSSPFAKPLNCNLSQKCGPEKLVTDKIGLLNEKVLGKIPSERGSKQKSEKKYCALRLSDQSTIVNNQNGVISNEKGSSGTPCLKAGESSSILTKNGLVEISRQSSMQGVHGQKEALDRQDHQKVPKPKKKLVKCRVSRMFLGSNKIFRTTLSLRKKKKHKRSKRHAVELRCFTQEDFLGEKCIAGGLGPSTSEKTRIIALDSTHSQKQASRSDANKANGYVAGKGVRVSDGDSLINNVDGDFRSRISLNNAVLATNEPPQKSSASMLAANQLDAGEPVSSQEKKKGLDQSGLMSMLMRGLEEAKVAHWDGIKLPPTQILGSSSAQSVSIGYVPDEWDEEYDRGKRKKVRSSKNSFGGPNPFQEVATTKAQLKKAKMDQNSSGNRPYRI